jgi:hypothetical protein
MNEAALISFAGEVGCLMFGVQRLICRLRENCA